MSVIDKQWGRIKQGYLRIINWMKSNALQLNLGTTMANVAIAFQGQFQHQILIN